MMMQCAYCNCKLSCNGELEDSLQKINDHLIEKHDIQPSENLTVTATEDAVPLFFVKVVNT